MATKIAFIMKLEVDKSMSDNLYCLVDTHESAQIVIQIELLYLYMS